MRRIRLPRTRTGRTVAALTAAVVLVGAFANEYATTTAGLKATAVKEQAIVQVQVSAVGVVSTSGGGVDVLVYLNQYRRNANITGEKVDQDRVLLTLVRAGRDCKVSRAAAI